jgi:methionyl-tRNA formyltransferase
MMSAPLKIVFLGSDPIALPLLNWLAGEGAALARVCAVFTQPDRPAGRGQRVRANAIKAWALDRGLPVHQPEKITEVAAAQLAALGADLAVVMAYGHILREEFIATPRLGSLNLHASILPRYRGASPIQGAIAGGERETGVTLMRIVRRLDAGPVADVERVPIAPLDTAVEIEAGLAVACVPLLARTLPKLRDGSLAFVAQDEAAATYCRRLEKEDGVLDFVAPATELAARINGLFPWPGCRAEINGQSIRLGLADVASASAPADPGQFHLVGEIGREAGTVLGADAGGLLVRTGAGVLRLRRMQRPGGRMLEAEEFLRGFPVAAGTRLGSQPMTTLVTRR